nr:Pycsar system effector family protein [Paenibacillus bovis]
MDKEDLYKQLDKVDDWINNADTKLGVVLAFIGVFSGFIISNDRLNRNVGNLLDSGTKVEQFVVILLIYLTSISLLLSIFMCIRGLMAKTNNSKKTLLFWGHVKEFKDYETFKRFKEQQSEEELKSDLYNQIHTNSVIVYNKFYRFRWSVIFTLISLSAYISIYFFSIL